MITITFTEFRKNASSFISKVEKGEFIQLIRHGKPVAEISPIRNKKSLSAIMEEAGLEVVHQGRGFVESHSSGTGTFSVRIYFESSAFDKCFA